MRTPSAAALILALGVAATAAQADVKVGVTAAVNPQAIGQPPTEPERVLMVGTDNFANEKITTGPAGQLQLLFTDGSSISVGPEANLTIDQYVYDPNTRKGKLAVSAAQGVFRFVGGAISKSDEVVITTPTGTAGIRGGVAVVSAPPPNSGPFVAAFLFGASLRVTANGETQVVTRPGFQITVLPGQAPSAPAKLSVKEVRDSLGNFQGKPGNSDKKEDTALDNSGVSNATGSNAPALLNNQLFNTPFNPNTQNTINNIVTQAANSAASGPVNLFGHFYASDLEVPGTFDTQSLAVQFNSKNVFNDTFVLNGSTVTFSVPAGSGVQLATLPFATQAFTKMFPNGTATGITIASPDRQFFEVAGQYTSLVSGGGCGGSGTKPCKFVGFGGVPTTNLPTSGVGVYTLVPVFNNIPFISNLSDSGANLLTSVGGAGTAISPLLTRFSPITNPTAAQGNDQRAVAMQASLVISGTGVNQQSGLFGLTGAFFQEQGAGVSLGTGVVGYALSSSTAQSIRVGGGEASTPIGIASGANGSAIYGPNANYIVMVPDILKPSPGNPTTRQTSEQIQLPFDTLGSQQSNNGMFNATTAISSGAPTNIGTQTTQTMQGYTGGGIENRISGNNVQISGFGGNAYNNEAGQTTGPSVTITTNAATNRLSAQFNFSDISNPAANQYQLQFGSTTGFSGGRSAFITDQIFAARDTLNPSDGVSPTSIANGTTVANNRLFLVSSGAVPIDFQSFAGPGVTACTCSFMKWGWWIGEVQNGNNSQFERFLGTWVVGNIPNAADIPQTGTAVYNGHAIATVSWGSGTVNSGAVARYIAAGNFQQTWNFGMANGSVAISNFDRGGAPGAAGLNLSGSVSAPGGLADQRHFTGFVSGAGVSGPLAGSFFRSPTDAVAGTGGSFLISGTVGGKAYGAGGTFAAQR